MMRDDESAYVTLLRIQPVAQPACRLLTLTLIRDINQTAHSDSAWARSRSTETKCSKTPDCCTLGPGLQQLMSIFTYSCSLSLTFCSLKRLHQNFTLYKHKHTRKIILYTCNKLDCERYVNAIKSAIMLTSYSNLLYVARAMHVMQFA
jgi:hypothetical protein